MRIALLLFAALHTPTPSTTVYHVVHAAQVRTACGTATLKKAVAIARDYVVVACDVTPRKGR